MFFTAFLQLFIAFWWCLKVSFPAFSMFLTQKRNPKKMVFQNKTFVFSEILEPAPQGHVGPSALRLFNVNVDYYFQQQAFSTLPSLSFTYHYFSSPYILKSQRQAFTVFNTPPCGPCPTLVCLGASGRTATAKHLGGRPPRSTPGSPATVGACRPHTPCLVYPEDEHREALE